MGDMDIPIVKSDMKQVLLVLTTSFRLIGFFRDEDKWRVVIILPEVADRLCF